MAAVSELAMVQAASLQLAAVSAQLESSLESARARLAAGQAPTEDAGRELARHLESEAAHASCAQRQQRQVRYTPTDRSAVGAAARDTSLGSLPLSPLVESGR